RKAALLARGHLVDLATDPDQRRRRATRREPDAQLRMGDLDHQPVPTVLDRKHQALELARQTRLEVQHLVAHLDPRIAALHQVYGAGHGAEVDALGGRAALYVVDIAAQRVAKQVPG